MGDAPTLHQPLATHQEASSAQETGTQSISRAFQILRCVARAGATGLRLRDITAQVPLNPSTAHRLLTALVAEGMVIHDVLHRQYRIGTDFLNLLESARDADLQRRYGDLVRYVAAKIGESTYLSVPTGTEVLCIARVLGASAIQPVPFDVGGRRPFGVGTAGIVALAAMPEHRIKGILMRHEPAFKEYGLTLKDIAPLVQECRETGYSYNPGLFIKGVGGIGVPINSPSGHLIGVLSVVALNSRLDPESQRNEIVGLLRGAIDDARDQSSILRDMSDRRMR